MVEDDPADAATEALVRGHGGRYVALGEPRGLNLARNAALAAAEGELLCFLDDDVGVWPGWLGALLAAAEAHPEHDAFGGPIRPVLEGTNLHACGREPLPVTALDLGPDDVDAELVWGANLAVRRAAVERVGAFDPVRSGPGDEEEWERRLRAAGGRIRYVAAAGVDHRRTGADARIAGLSRAAWHRGRHGRRYDEEKGVAPSLPAELRTLAGCVWHIGRRRCGNGIVLTAQTAGRIREALTGGADRGAAAGERVDRPYLAGQSGTLGRRGPGRGPRARPRRGRADRTASAGALRRAARDSPPRRRVHVARRRPAGAPRRHRRDRRRAARSRHDVTLQLAAGAPGLGKWENLRAAAPPPPGTDWLLLVDDDVVLPPGFLDVFLHVAEAHDLQLAQPAHAFASHAAWPVTRRRPGLVARRTPLRRDRPGDRDPTPTRSPRCCRSRRSRWAGGSTRTGRPRRRAAGLTLGIVDATPVRHLRPVAASYPHADGDRGGRRLPRRARARHARGGGPGARGVDDVKVAVVAEYYPRADDPVLGVWAHRQALAARDAGAEVRVLVLHRPVPSYAALRSRDPRAARGPAAPAAPARARRDRGALRAVRGAAAARAPTGAGAPGRRRRSRSPCGGCGAASRSTSSTPTTPPRPATRSAARGPACRWSSPSTAATCCAVARALRRRRRGRARGPGARAARAGQLRGASRRAAARSAARDVRVVHLGTDLPPQPEERRPDTLVTVANLVARKRHADVLRALWLLRDRHPELALGRRRRRPGARRRSSASRGELGLDGRVRFHGALAARGRARGGAGGRRLRAAERRRGLRRRLRRGDGGRRARDRLPRRAGAGGDRRRRARACGSCRPRDPEALAAEIDALDRRARLAAGARPGGAGHRRGRVHLGAAAVARPCRRTRTRCDERRPAAGPVRDQPRAGVPRRRVRGAARAAGRRVRADRRRHAPRRRGGRDAALPFPVAAPAGARRAAARRVRALPGGRRGLSGRVALPGGVRRRPARRRPVRALGDDLAPPAHRRPRALLPAAAPALPPRGRHRHLRAARLGLRARQGRTRDRSSRRRRASTTRSGPRLPQPHRLAAFQAMFAGRLEEEKGLPVLLDAWQAARLPDERALVLAGDGPFRVRGPRPAAPTCRGGSARRKSATSTPARTSSWCRRSPRATSSSRGGWWSTKPSTRECP